MFLVNCSRNKYEKELIGVWNDFPSGGSNEFRFYEDSIIHYTYNIYRKGTWQVDKSQIKFHFPKELAGFNTKFTLDYKLSENKDALFAKLPKDSVFSHHGLFKVNNYWIHYLRKFDFQINLPEANFEMTKNEAIEYGIDLFVGYKNKKLIVKLDHPLEYGNDISSFIKPYIYSERAIWEEEEIKNLYFNLIADKNVSEQHIDSIKNILNVFPKMKIFRVYKNDNANYGKYDLDHELFYDWSWYGRFE
ncbi:hypothetical protein [Aureibaculum luteum]|uniref:hypothetical protein n=1 Tax=Aureibaculum luteum TaxID=1548456 RepID=UPI000E4DD527|nr:hypothetical protein [Aureibaculum luteum]